jgi:hypothetical protein
MMCWALGWVVAAAGCGDTPTHDRRKSRETADAPAPLPRGWHRVADTRAGFTVGLPPGWTSQVGSTSTIARSGAGDVALSVSADGSRDGQKDAPEKYLRRTAAHLGGYRELRLDPVQPVEGLAYPAATVTATGVFAQTGVRQQIQLYALRRPGRVTYSISVFRSAYLAASRDTAQVDGILRSFRARPPRA